MLNDVDHVLSGIYSEVVTRDEFTCNYYNSSRLLYVVVRPSLVCMSVVCNVRAPYSGD